MTYLRALKNNYSDSQIPHWDANQTSGLHPTYCVTPLTVENQHYYHLCVLKGTGAEVNSTL